MSTDPDRPPSIDADSAPQSASISRRSFSASIGAGALGAAVHQVLGANLSASEAPRSDSATPELCGMTAVDLAARLRKKEVSAREVMTAHLAQIERVNPKVNAIVTLVAERAMANAAKADEAIARGGRSGVLHGLPVAHKDLVETAGIRTTYGSPFYRDNVPTHDALIVTSDPRCGRDHAAARRTRRSSAPDRRRSIRFSARRTIPTTSAEDVRRQQWRRGDGARLPDAADR